MTSAKVDSIIKKVVDILTEKYQPDKIILFGSYAYGNYTEDSDIDILIIKKQPKREELIDLLRLKGLFMTPKTKSLFLL